MIYPGGGGGVGVKVMLKLFLPEAWIKGNVLGLYLIQDLAFTELPEYFKESYEVNRNGFGKMAEISMQLLQ